MRCKPSTSVLSIHFDILVTVMSLSSFRRSFPALMVLSMVLASFAHSATYIVNSSANSGSGTLRQAIIDANTAPGPDVIEFNIPVTLLPATITLDSPLPPITSPVFINGYSQPGSSQNTLLAGSNAVLGIEVSGENLESGSGLVITAGNCTMSGLVINRFPEAGISLLSANNIVQGNFIGTDATGTQKRSNGVDGVFVGNGSLVGADNFIGGTNPSARNVISGNGRNGITLDQVQRTTIAGNIIGLNSAGAGRLGNEGAGIGVFIGADNTIGGVSTAARNIVSGNFSNGIELNGTSGNLVQNNYVGVNAAGTDTVGNDGVGITLFDEHSSNSVRANVISGNRSEGVEVDGGGGTTVAGNIIGLLPDGATKKGNLSNGISLYWLFTDSPAHMLIPTTIGGASAADRNTISGNDGHGIGVYDGGYVKIVGNYIGTDTTGNGGPGNARRGVYVSGGEISTDGVVIGGFGALERNVIGKNGETGIYLSNADDTEINGNFIGVGADGSSNIGNGGDGIAVTAYSRNTIVRRNVIGNNAIAGVAIGRSEDPAFYTFVQKNIIGLNATASAGAPNAFEGVIINDASDNNTIGLSMESRPASAMLEGQGNIIAGNLGAGVSLVNARNNIVSGNYVGTTPGGSAFGNGGDGVSIAQTFRTPDGNIIGGYDPDYGNIIAYNGGAGVKVNSGTRNLVRSNNIFSNMQIGIDINGDGVTPNEPSGSGIGPNNLQAYPVLNFAASDIQAIQGLLTGSPNTQYTIEFFSNINIDPTGFGEGERLIGAHTLTTDDSGKGSFFVTFPGKIVNGEFITATATDPNNNTSEFSRAVSIATKVKVFGNHYVINTTLSGIPLHWREGRSVYRIHTSVPTAFRPGIDMAYGSWNDLPELQYVNGGLTDTSTWGGDPDGINNNVWVTSGWEALTGASENTIAVTRVRYNALNGEITDSDIAYDAQHFSWTVVSGVNDVDMDVENVTAHEVGHYGGMGDIYNPGTPGYVPQMGSGNEFVTMFGLIRRGEVSKRTLESPDTAGTAYIYRNIPKANIDLMLVFDGSNSFANVQGALTPAKNAAVELLQRMRVGDRIGIIKMPNTVVFPLTAIAGDATRDAAAAAINALTAGGSSAIGSGLLAAQASLNASALQTSAKSILLFSTGEENAAPSALTVLSQLRTSNITAHTLGFAGSPGQPLSNIIADSTGGTYHLATNATMSSVVQQIWNTLVGQTFVFQTSAPSDTFDNVPQPGVSWQGPVGPGNAVIFPGVSWQGPVGNQSAVAAVGSYVLSIQAPNSAILIDSAYAAQNPQLGVQFFSGPTYSFFRVSNPAPGVWTLFVYARSLPTQLDTVQISISAITDVTMDFGFDKASYALNEVMQLDAELIAGGTGSGDPHIVNGGPITDATVTVDMTVPGSAVPQQIPLLHTGNGVYRANFSSTSLPGTYDAVFKAVRGDLELTGRLSAYAGGPPPPPPTGIQSDDFNASTLKQFWTYVNPANPSQLSLTGTGTADAVARIQVPGGASHDIWVSGNNAPRLMQDAPNENFEVEVKFQGQMTGQYQMQGILVEESPTRFLRFDFVKGSSNTRIFAASFTNGVPSVLRDFSIPQGNPAWMRLKRQGNDWIQSYSYNGVDFTVLPAFLNVTLNVTRIGPFVGNAGYPEGTAPAFTGMIDYFFNLASPITPEDGIASPPNITQQPQNAAVSIGQTAMFSITATGTPPLTFQWQKNQVDISGANTAAYTTPPATAGDNGASFQCIISNALGTLTSNAAILSVNTRVDNGLLVKYDFNEGSGLTVNDVSGFGAPLNLTIPDASTIQWVAGALRVTAPSVIVSAAAATKVMNAVNVSNEISIEAWLTPHNTTQKGPARILTISGDAGNRNVTLGQGLWDAQPSALYDVRLRTTSTNGNGQPELYTPDGSLTTALTHVVYTRNSAGNAKLYLNGVETAAMNVGGNFSNWNSAYKIGVANEFNASRPWLGTLHMAAIYGRALSMTEVELNFAAGPEGTPAPTPPSIVQHPQNSSVIIGATASFSVVASGTLPLSYQWQKNNSDISGATNASYTTPATTAGDNNAEFRCVVSNALGTVTSNVAVLTVLPQTIEGVLVKYDFNEGSGLQINDVSGVGTPFNLTIPSGAPVSWVAGGLSINGPTLIQSAAPATKIINGATASNEVSIEAWVMPQNTTQKGPARIVTISADPNNRNVTLGQGMWGTMPSALYNGRLRTTATNLNGQPELATADGSLTTSLTHVVYTRGAAGTAKLYLNGVESAVMTVGGTFSTWNSSYKLGLANEFGLGRAWLGTYYRVVIYSKALSISEVGLLYNAGSEGTLTRPEGGGTVGKNSAGAPVAQLIPKQFGLEENFPNPFNPSTTIQYGLPVEAHVSVKIYNTLGQEVVSLADAVQQAGYYTVVWDGKNASGNPVGSGVYFYRMKTDRFTATKRMLLMK